MNAKNSILHFAKQLESSKPGRRLKFKVLPPTAKELYVPASRFPDLLTIGEAMQKKLLKGSKVFLNRKAGARELKAIKIPGSKEWHVLPEWLEEFNNRGSILNHGR